VIARREITLARHHRATMYRKDPRFGDTFSIRDNSALIVDNDQDYEGDVSIAPKSEYEGFHTGDCMYGKTDTLFITEVDPIMHDRQVESQVPALHPRSLSQEKFSF
jgi:hypothetical protein